MANFQTAGKVAAGLLAAAVLLTLFAAYAEPTMTLALDIIAYCF